MKRFTPDQQVFILIVATIILGLFFIMRSLDLISQRKIIFEKNFKQAPD